MPDILGNRGGHGKNRGGKGKSRVPSVLPNRSSKSGRFLPSKPALGGKSRKRGKK